MVFCNKLSDLNFKSDVFVTILILIDGFLQYKKHCLVLSHTKVTILILIDGFLQLEKVIIYQKSIPVTILILIDGFLQCFRYPSLFGWKKSQSLF